jgi:hypothetical protein
VGCGSHYVRNVRYRDTPSKPLQSTTSWRGQTLMTVKWPDLNFASGRFRPAPNHRRHSRSWGARRAFPVGSARKPSEVPALRRAARNFRRFSGQELGRRNKGPENKSVKSRPAKGEGRIQCDPLGRRPLVSTTAIGPLAASDPTSEVATAAGGR